MPLSRDGLVAKLNASSRSALAGAANLAAARTHYEVDLEHLMTRMLEQTDGDVAAICRHFGVDTSRALTQLTRALDRAKSGNSRNPVLSPRIVHLMQDAWSVASVDYNSTQVRTGFLVLSMITSESTARLVLDSCAELRQISIESLRTEMASICEGSTEDLSGLLSSRGKNGNRAGASAGDAPGGATKTNLEQYTIDLTESARTGRIDPVLGRDAEIRQMVDILTRRRQNNPILTGEAGVGKTAVVEGLALRIAQGDVPPDLSKVVLRMLDLTLLQAGASVRGEFENRLKGVIAEVKQSAVPIVLFIDEAHTMIGAGGQAGQNDAANLLKPALARGELRTIAATTWSEYKKYFEKDAALARRFQVVKVEEPTECQANVMLRGIKDSLEKHHRVTVLDEAVTAAVRLSKRYITGRQLPDKAVGVLDTACARVALAQNATPASLEDAQRQRAYTETEIAILERESATGALHVDRLDTLVRERELLGARIGELEERLARERELVSRMIALRFEIEQLVVAPHVRAPVLAGVGTGPEANGAMDEADQHSVELGHKREELGTMRDELAALQGEDPLVHPYVDAEIVAEVIAAWTGIPVGKMLKDELETVLRLKDLLAKRVIGQDHALEAIGQRISTARAGLDDPNRPIGVFLLVGPSGVGKTETALALADILYGGERNLLVINMSEYQEPHSVSGLKGSPPGYVGFGEGGVLTEGVRRKPYSVLLLDEMEKAHTDVMELFYQVFDKGFMEDAEGREVDFKNTVILMTSNAASDLLIELCSEAEAMPSVGDLTAALMPELRKIFKPALLGRLVVVPYFPIGDKSLRGIIRLKMERIRDRVNETHHVPLTYTDELVEEVGRRCTEVETGARNVDHILTGTLLPAVSTELLSRMVSGEPLHRVHVDVDPGQGFVYELA